MGRFGVFRSQARYSILTPVALLGFGIALSLGGPALAADHTNSATIAHFDIPAGDSLTNTGTINNPDGDAVNAEENITFLTNAAGASIVGDHNAVHLFESVGTLTNAGSIVGSWWGVGVNGDVDKFNNSGLISGASDAGVSIGGDVTTAFTNSGQIYSYGSGGESVPDAISIGGAVTAFSNTKTGIIGSAARSAVSIEGAVGSFGNDGVIRSSGYGDCGCESVPTVLLDGGVVSFVNSGTGEISNLGNGGAVQIYGANDDETATVGSFTNAGTIWSLGSDAVHIEAGGEGGIAANTIVNSGSVLGAGAAFGIYGDVGDFTNTASGNISGNGVSSYGGQGAIYIEGAVTGAFANAGSISGGMLNGGAFVIGPVNSFTNSGSISGQLAGVGIEGHVTTFANTKGGTIEGNLLVGVAFGDGVGAFSNAGVINGPKQDFGGIVPLDVGGPYPGAGASVYGNAGTFTNSGIITGVAGGVVISGGFDTLNNSGRLTGVNGPGLYVAGQDTYKGEDPVPANFGTLTNSGTIEGRYFGAYINNTSPLVIVNSGTIRTNDVTPADSPNDVTDFDFYMPTSVGLMFNGSPVASTLNNSGTIQGGIGVGVVVEPGQNATIINSGSIIGTNGPGIQFFDVGVGDPTVVNSGLISGANGIAVDFAGTTPNHLILQTGGRFIGKVQYGPGPNTFDFSGYDGNLLLDYTGGNPALTAGDRLFVQKGTQIAIVDDTAIRDAAQPVADLVAGVRDSLSGAMNGGAATGADQFVANYAPSGPTTPASNAAAAVGAPVAPAGTDYWGSVFGGGDANSTAGAGTSTRFGGLVAGAHAAVAPGFNLGVLGGYGRTSFSVDHGPQTVTADTGIVGVYGVTALDTVTLDFSVLAGFASNASSRQISTGLGFDTATATFNSWFLAPEIGASIPVLQLTNGEFNVAGRLGYIGGSFAGYTETGSAADLTVGSETIGVFNASIELNGKTVLGRTGGGDMVLSGKVGVFSQNNAGGSSVPVAVLGQTAGTVVASGASGVGVYGGVGLDLPVSDALTVGTSLTASYRNDGTYGGLGRLRVGGSF